jgi:hypothetical protein
MVNWGGGDVGFFSLTSLPPSTVSWHTVYPYLPSGTLTWRVLLPTSWQCVLACTHTYPLTLYPGVYSYLPPGIVSWRILLLTTWRYVWHVLLLTLLEEVSGTVLKTLEFPASIMQ